MPAATSATGTDRSNGGPTTMITRNENTVIASVVSSRDNALSATTRPRDRGVESRRSRDRPSSSPAIALAPPPIV